MALNQHMLLPATYCRALVSAFFVIVSAWNGAAQDVNILKPIGEDGFESVERILSIPPGNTASVRILLGFATDETFAPGQFLDSFTLSVIGSSSQSVATLVTADASGFQWLPFTPGGVAIDPSLLAVNEVSFPGTDPVLSFRNAYEIQFTPPSQFAGQPVTFAFDLFDNQNALQSYGVYSELVLVPEPSISALVVCGSLLGAWLAHKRKRFLP